MNKTELGAYGENKMWTLSHHVLIHSYKEEKGLKKDPLGQLWEVEENIEVPSNFLKLFQYYHIRFLKKKKKNSPLSNELRNPC